MENKYKKKCWSCGSRDMENKGSYVQCRKCGATWCGIPSSDSLAGEGQRMVHRTDKGQKVTTSATPSKRAIRDAAKARLDKGV